MSGWYNGNRISYGAGGHWYAQLFVTDDGAKQISTTPLRISYRIVFENTVTDSMNAINGSDPAGSWSADNHSFSGAGNYLIAQRDFECTIVYGGSSAHITMSASGLPGGGTSTVTVDYPMPGRQYTNPSAPPTSVDFITATSARIVVGASTDGGGAGISNYFAYILTNNAWPYEGGNVVAEASGGTFTATNLQRAHWYCYTARVLSTAGIYSAWYPMQSFYTLATVPDPTSAVTLTAITQNSMATQFYGRSDGGATITRWELGYGTSPTAPQTVVTSNGTLTVNGLLPGTDYYFWSRGVNARGTGGWSARSTAKTLPGVYVNVGGVWKNAIPYVNVGGVWKQAIRVININNVWRQ